TIAGSTACASHIVLAVLLAAAIAGPAIGVAPVFPVITPLVVTAVAGVAALPAVRLAAAVAGAPAAAILIVGAVAAPVAALLPVAALIVGSAVPVLFLIFPVVHCDAVYGFGNGLLNGGRKAAGPSCLIAYRPTAVLVV